MTTPLELVERPDGTLALLTNADPAGVGHQVLGYRRLSCALDVGGRGDDPSAFVVIRAEQRPYMTGRGWQQALTPPEYTIVWSETVRLDEATDVVGWTVSRLRQLRNWRFCFDATGMGAPLLSLFEAAKVPALGIQFTAGSSWSRKGQVAYVSKSLLYENAAACLENGSLRIASGLAEAEKAAILKEAQSIEYATTSAGNLTLKSGGKGHHADRFAAAAMALIQETHVGTRDFRQVRLSNFFG